MRARDLLQQTDNELFFSYASLQELLNKIGRGKLRLTTGSVDDAIKRIEALGVLYLPFTVDEIVAASKLPHHHSDPFDRILIAQAQAHALQLVTIDEDIQRYAVQTIWD